MEAMFSQEDGLAYMDSLFDSSPTDEASKNRMVKVQGVLKNLPGREEDIISLYYFKGWKQVEIAQLFRVSQPTICYRLQRASARIRYFLEMPETDRARMEKDMTGFLKDSLDVQIMVRMFDTTCQTAVAEQLGVSQGKVRHRYLRTLKKLRQAPPPLHKYVAIFEHVFNHLNILRDAHQPDEAKTYILA